jgi:hypothetical protein
MEIKIPLVSGAGNLWRAWSVQAAVIGAVLPELLQLIADNSSALPWFDTATRDAIRLVCLLLIPILRVLPQGGALAASRAPE